MIRILIPRFVYNDKRIQLLERMTGLSFKNHEKIQRAVTMSYREKELFLEGYLENETKLHIAAMRLTDDPIFMKQEQITDMPTWLIEDAKDIPY